MLYIENHFTFKDVLHLYPREIQFSLLLFESKKDLTIIHSTNSIPKKILNEKLFFTN